MVLQASVEPNNDGLHIQEVDHENEQEHDNGDAHRNHDRKPAVNDFFHLGAAIQVQAPESLFLVLDEYVDVVFPNPRDLCTLAAERVLVQGEAAVLGWASVLHELDLVELGHYKGAFGGFRSQVDRDEHHRACIPGSNSHDTEEPEEDNDQELRSSKEEPNFEIGSEVSEVRCD